MSSARGIGFGLATVFLVLGASVLLAQNALAGSLLSGYGGPGAGSQTIIGSEILAGGGGGAPPSGGGAAPTGPAGTAPSHTTPGRAAPKGQGGGASTHDQGAGRGARSRGTRGKRAPDTTGHSSTSTSTVRATAEKQPLTLGLSSTDVFYVLLGLIVLALTAAFTRRLLRSEDARRGISAKGMGTSARVGN
jgi:hypothetical protein